MEKVEKLNYEFDNANARKRNVNTRRSDLKSAASQFGNAGRSFKSAMHALLDFFKYEWKFVSHCAWEHHANAQLKRGRKLINHGEENKRSAWRNE